MKELDQRKYLNGRLKELITVALNTGMRLSNIAGMKRGNVRMENRTITFLLEKTKRQLTIPMNDCLYDFFLRNLKGRAQ